jgi:hypothetical protein
MQAKERVKPSFNKKFQEEHMRLLSYGSPRRNKNE